MTNPAPLDEMVDGAGGIRPHWGNLLGAMAGLEEHELPDGVQSHIEQVLADIRKMRAALPPDR